MAVLKRSLRRKNATGNYDTIRLESDSSIVYRPSGRTVEQDLAAYLPSTQSSDVVPKTLSFGKIVTGQSRLFAGGQDNILELALQPSNLIDTTDATATAADIRSGETAYANGQKLIGTLVPIDTSDATAVASDIKSGKTAYSKGTKISGSMSTITLGTPTITVSSSGLITAKVTHSSSGYVASGTKTKTLQLSSSQDSDFIASNIKSGVNIFGITGTLSSGNVKCTFGNPSSLCSVTSSTLKIGLWTQNGNSDIIKAVYGLSARLDNGNDEEYVVHYPYQGANTAQILWYDEIDSVPTKDECPVSFHSGGDGDAYLALDISNLLTRLKNRVTAGYSVGGTSYYYFYLS